MTTRFTPYGSSTAHTAAEHSLDHFRSALEEQRRFRIEQLRQLDTDLTDRPDRTAGADPLTEVTAALRAAAQTALTDVDAALARLRTDSYGWCLRCHREIAPERLEIVPMASLCMSCQRVSEAGELDADIAGG